MRLVAPLDPLEGYRYVEPIRGEYDTGELDNIYIISSRLEDYVNPMVECIFSW